jgi:hypothetical protein
MSSTALNLGIVEMLACASFGLVLSIGVIMFAVRRRRYTKS